MVDRGVDAPDAVRAGRRGFRRGPVTADLEPGVWTLAADGPHRSGPDLRDRWVGLRRVGISEGERRGRGRGEHGGCDTGGKGS
jgi:hypothetical protein